MYQLKKVITFPLLCFIALFFTFLLLPAFFLTNDFSLFTKIIDYVAVEKNHPSI